VDERTHIQKTISSKITVFYPFHPLHGLELEVVCKPKSGVGAITVIDPQGKRLKIPSWMVSPQASGYQLSERAEISIRALSALTNLLESTIKVKNEMV